MSLVVLIFLAVWALLTWAIIRADTRDEERLRRQLARIVGTPEWFAAQRLNGGSAELVADATSAKSNYPTDETRA